MSPLIAVRLFELVLVYPEELWDVGLISKWFGYSSIIDPSEYRTKV